MTSKQTIRRDWKGKGPRTLRKTPAREITPQTADWSLQDVDDTDAKTVTLKKNSGVMASKAAASNRSTNGQLQGSKLSSSTPMLPAPWLSQRRKWASSPNLGPA